MQKDDQARTGWGVSLWYMVVAPLLVLALVLAFGDSPTEEIAYSDFKRLVEANLVRELELGPEKIVGSMQVAGAAAHLPQAQAQRLQRSSAVQRRFSTIRVQDPELIALLERAGVRYTGKVPSQLLWTLLFWLVPIGLLLWWSLWMGRRAGLGGPLAAAAGKSRARVYLEHDTGITFDDVAGIDEAREELREIVDFLKRPERYQKLGAKIPKGVLIVGAPGTGKTLLAKALAGEAGVPFFSISGSEFVEMFVGVGAARVRDLFAQAQEKSPCIVFIDELDALGKARAGGAMAGTHSEQDQTLNQLLVEMDGFDANNGVLILAATNRPEVLDPALLRPGRFDRHVALDLPDLNGRSQILAVHVRKVRLAPDVTLDQIAARTAGFAGADLANLVNEATLLAARAGKEQVQLSDFNEAIDRVVVGLEKKTRVMQPREKETVAYHEAGHALIAQFRVHADRVLKVSIIPRGIMALGNTQQVPSEQRFLHRRAELHDRIDVLLGGRVAEELALGDVSTGAQNDLQIASDLARSMVTRYGMSERLGLATFEDVRAPMLNPQSLVERKPYSDRSAETIDAEVRRLLAEAHARVLDTLRSKRDVLDALAHLLLKHETVERAEIDALINAPKDVHVDVHLDAQPKGAAQALPGPARGANQH